MNQQDFRVEYDQTMSLIRQGIEKFPWHDRELYADWCAQTFYYVLHSTHLLAMTAALIPPSNMKMHYRFVRHLREESGHEVLAKRDCESLGFDCIQFPELTETRGFYQTQYHQIQNIHPLTFFGYIFMLEGLSVTVGPFCYDKVVGAHGEKCANFIKAHSEEDQKHIVDAFEHIKDFENDLMDKIVLNMRDSAVRYLGLCEAIKSRGAAHRRAA